MIGKYSTYTDHLPIKKTNDSVAKCGFAPGF